MFTHTFANGMVISSIYYLAMGQFIDMLYFSNRNRSYFGGNSNKIKLSLSNKKGNILKLWGLNEN